MKRYIQMSTSEIDNIEMIVEGEISGEVSVGLSINYSDGTFKTIYNNLIPFPKYEVISLSEIDFEDTAIMVTLPDERETEESSTLVFREILRDMGDAGLDAIIDTFNSMMNIALSDIESPNNKADRTYNDDSFYFHATIRNGKGVID
jgi:hypothetical protein